MNRSAHLEWYKYAGRYNSTSGIQGLNRLLSSIIGDIGATGLFIPPKGKEELAWLTQQVKYNSYG